MPGYYKYEYSSSLDETIGYDPNLKGDTNSPRTDGKPWGSGCGAKDSDHLVPDMIAIVLGKKAVDFNGRNVAGTYRFSLVDACKIHDKCYETYARTGSRTRNSCDSELGENVRRACDQSGAPMEVCNAIGRAYYTGVDVGAEQAWIDSGGKPDPK